MCIVVYHPCNAKPIPKSRLKICFQNNDDGAGYTYFDKKKNKWIISKGFMEWDDFWNSFKTHDFQSNSIWAAHFRIATSGNTDSGNTHPFPICNNYKTMRKTSMKSDTIAFHNGVMGKGDEIASDTMKHIKTILSPLNNKISENKFKPIFEHLCNTSSNRWLIANKETLLLLGDWKKFKGSYYSNTSYEKVKTYVTTNNYGYFNNKYDYDNWYDRYNSEKEKPLTNKEKRWESILNDEKVECPVCKEKEFVTESLFSVFKFRCYNCGAVFDRKTKRISFFVPVEENIV